MVKAFSKPLVGGLLLTALLLTGCGGGSGSGGTTAPPAGAPTVATPSDSSGKGGQTLAQQIERLERKGSYPKLDRSSDIAGPDLDSNGVRDDVEAWIGTLGVTEPQRKALMQKARALQQTLRIDLDDPAALQHAGEGLAASTLCAGDRFAPARSDAYAITAQIEAMTANTRERAARYMQYNKARSGSSTTYPSGDTCEP